MAITKEKKEAILEKLSRIASGEGTRVFVNFHGLTVSEAGNLRKGLREKGVEYFVAKKTLIRKAFQGGRTEGEMSALPGEAAIAWSDDPLLAAQEIFAFTRTLKDRFSIQGGVFEGKFADAEFMTTLAMIPPKPVLLGQFVFSLNSPIQQFAMALHEIAKSKNQ